VSRSDHVMSAMVLGVCGVAAPASADVFTPHFPITELHSVQGGYSGGSFAAAGVMGEQGYANDGAFPGWETSLIASCTSMTQEFGGSIWPESCNPHGMAQALQALTSHIWVAELWPAANQAGALNRTVAAVQAFGSPVAVPIYGQADHWVTVTQITATSNGSGGWVVNAVRFYDGGPPGGLDSGFNNYEAGVQAFSGVVWRNIHFTVVTGLNPACDAAGCVSDPYYGQYLIVIEPPIGASPPTVTAEFPKARGVVQGGMTEALAQAEVWNALAAAGVTADPAIGSPIRGGVAGPAFQVHAVFPSGAPWDYYLVPVVSPANTVLAFVQLAADDGAFEGVRVLTTPARFAPVTRTQAEALAARALAPDERLAGGVLTWNPRTKTQLGRSPTSPYYEFGVVDTAGRGAGVVRVALDHGLAERGR